MQVEFGCSYLFISHDLAVVRQMADRLAVMSLGRVVEEGDAEPTLEAPAHPYTVALMSSVPTAEVVRPGDRRPIVLSGEVPSPVSVPDGCVFRTRCWKAEVRCTTDVPPLAPIRSRSAVACHFPEGT